MLCQNSPKVNRKSALLRTAMSQAISRLSIFFSLKSLLSLVKIEKSSNDSCNIGDVLGSPLATFVNLRLFSSERGLSN